MQLPKPSACRDLRRDALRIFQAGIDAADPYQAVKRCLSVNNNHLSISLNLNDKTQNRCSQWQKIYLIAIGKAACAMARAAQKQIPKHLLANTGIAVTNYENVTSVEHFDVIGAAHPLPDASGLKASWLIAERVSQAKQGELVLVLISGGGSALIPYPLTGISLADKIATTDLLLACGATINQINCVRKHLSHLKGGGLAKLAAPADLHTLILSDVLGDDLSSIASGPTVPDNTTFTDAADILHAYKIWDKLPDTIRIVLSAGTEGKIPETPKPNDPIFNRTGHTLIGSNGVSVRASFQYADELGYKTQLYSEHLCGEARIEAENWVLHAKKLRQQNINKPIALLAGGETTVKITGSGLGGRNQEMALAFSLAAEKHRLTGNWSFLSGGTDGRDGPTDAAGGRVDPDTLTRMRASGIDPNAYLADNNSYQALAGSHDLLITGATGTNVADLQVLLLLP